ncbi:hypothetical protein O5D80_005897 [Batrachochytrium dendrobatidis]|nr:hypothetical protein O5D80_005897 [Batrachochytrium dendrobatidis]
MNIQSNFQCINNHPKTSEFRPSRFSIMSRITTKIASRLPSVCVRARPAFICASVSLFNPLNSTQWLRSSRGFSTTVLSSAPIDIPSKSTTTNGPLSGIRILDLSRVLAGPYCTMILGDMGAEVIKVENTGSGDDTRTWGPPFAPNKDGSTTNQESAYFLGVNRNKKSIQVNFKTPQGLAIIKKLAASADVLVENYIPGKLDAIGLGYEAMQKINPRLVYASITGYGPDGPYKSHAGYDLIIEAEAGLMHITGEQDGPPVKVGVAVTDIITGLYTHGAILAALMARNRTGRGQKIDSSLLECQVAALANIAHNYLVAGQEAKRWGTQHSAIVPYQAFPTQDGDVVIGVGNDKQFAKLCEALKQPDLAFEEKFATNRSRVQNRKELLDILCPLVKKYTRQEMLDMLDTLGIPFGPVNNLEQTFSHPQVLHRKMVVEVDHPKSGKIKLVGVPVKYSDTKPSVRLPPPLLGQHTRNVLVDDLGFSDAEVDELKAKGVV